MNGVDALSAWWPATLLARLDPHASVSTETLRAALSTALAVTLFVLVFRVLRWLGGGVVWLFTPIGSDAGLVDRGAPVRALAGVAFVALPWARVIAITQGEGDDPAWTAFGMLAGTLWAGLRILDRRLVRWEWSNGVLRLRSGAGPWPGRETVFSLDAILTDQATGAPIADKERGRAVRLRADARKLVLAALGAERGERWLVAALAERAHTLVGARGRER